MCKLSSYRRPGNKIDYPAIARQLAGYDRAAVKTAFFEAVAPVCHSNLQAPIPPMAAAPFLLVRSGKSSRVPASLEQH
ncbi:DUF7079 family protein [Stutzerimonas degradans]